MLLEQGEAWHMMIVLLLNLLINANNFSVMIASYKRYLIINIIDTFVLPLLMPNYCDRVIKIVLHITGSLITAN